MRPVARSVPGTLLPAAILFTAILFTAMDAADVQAAPCHGGLKPKDVAELMFGRDIGIRLGASEAGWERFVAHEITPRFPDGLTVSDALGQWRDRTSGKIVREPSKRVEIVLPGNDDDQARLDAVVAAYKRQFRQQAVGVIVRSACVSF
jgi:Protein of unknown function (DUF3574)